MGRPRLLDIIEEDILRMWRNDPSLPGAEIHRRYIRIVGHEVVSARTVRKIISEEKKKLSHVTSTIVPAIPLWFPWSYSEETSSETAFLLRMRQVSLSLFDKELSELEATWAKKLRVILDGLNPFLQLCFFREYAGRESTAERFRTGIFTEDLDPIIGYQPWLNESHERGFFESETYMNSFRLTDVGGNGINFGLFIGTRLSDLQRTWVYNDPAFLFWTNGQGNIWDPELRPGPQMVDLRR